MADTDKERALEAARLEMQISEAATEARKNTAVMAYFDSVEAAAIDAILECDALDDEARLKLTVVGQTVRSLKKYLLKAQDMREFVQNNINNLTEEPKDG